MLSNAFPHGPRHRAGRRLAATPRVEARPPADAGGRGGFTLVEMIAAVTILAFGILGISTSAARMITVATTTEADAAAVQAAGDRLAVIQMSPGYAELDSMFGGEEEDVPGLHPDCTRSTEVERTEEDGEDGRVLDYVRITVTVSCPGSPDPVVRMLIVGAS